MRYQAVETKPLSIHNIGGAFSCLLALLAAGRPHAHRATEQKEDREVVMHRYQDGAATEQLQGRWVGVADEDPAWGMVKNPDQDSGR